MFDCFTLFFYLEWKCSATKDYELVCLLVYCMSSILFYSVVRFCNSSGEKNSDKKTDIACFLFVRLLLVDVSPIVLLPVVDISFLNTFQVNALISFDGTNPVLLSENFTTTKQQRLVANQE
jgi:hypothetical protein